MQQYSKRAPRYHGLSPLMTRFFDMVEEQHVSYDRISEKAGVDHAAISRWASRGLSPRLDCIEAAGNVLGHTLRWAPIREDDVSDKTSETTTKIVIGNGGEEVATLYPDPDVSLEEQRRHFCLMLAAEQQVPPDKIVDLAAQFDEYLREGAAARPTIKVVK